MFRSSFSTSRSYNLINYFALPVYFLIVATTTAFAQVSVGTIKQVSVGVNNTIPAGNSGSPAIAINGQQLVFNSSASNLVSGDTNSVKDIFQTNLLSGVTTISSINTAGSQANAESANPSISPVGPEGGFAIAFESDANNLSSLADPLNFRDIFVRIPSLGITEIVSLGIGSTNSNGNSRATSLTSLQSPNKLLITFESNASNLIPADTNNFSDVFLATLTIPKTSSASELLSSLRLQRIAGQSEPNGESSQPKISGDGNYIVFSSNASNLVPGIVTSGKQVFRYKVATSEISLVSRDAGGLAGNADSYGATVSYSGRFVSYVSESSSIVSGASAGKAAVVIFDALNSSSIRGNTNAEGIGADGSARDALLSANGRVVTFSDSSTNLSSGDTNNVNDIFIKDLLSGQISRASIGESGNQANADSDLSTIASNGFTASSATLAYRSFATNFTSSGLSSGADIFANEAAFAARALGKLTKLEVPADVAVVGRKASLDFESFSSVAAITLSSAVTPGSAVRIRAAKKVAYDIRVNRIGAKKKENIRKIIKKNQISLKKLKPGNYTSKYRVLTMNGKKTVAATNFSPIQKFTVFK